jgi:hypothetical protein
MDNEMMTQGKYQGHSNTDACSAGVSATPPPESILQETITVHGDVSMQLSSAMDRLVNLTTRLIGGGAVTDENSVLRGSLVSTRFSTAGMLGQSYYYTLNLRGELGKLHGLIDELEKI